jgi:hypothetical protein
VREVRAHIAPAGPRPHRASGTDRTWIPISWHLRLAIDDYPRHVHAVLGPNAR